MRKMDTEVFEKVCIEIESTHRGLNTICKEHGSSASAFYDWVDGNPEATERYARAKDRQADYLADLMLEEAFNDEDDEIAFVGVNHIQRDRLKVDTLKFIAAKLKPKKYGDKIDVTSDGKEIKTTTIINLGSGVKPDDEVTT
jgi:hypothetical protein